MTRERKAFRNNNGRGFLLTFPNGVTLSTQFGWANYCENYDSHLSIADEMAKIDWESDNAEIAIFASDGQWITREFEDNGDDVIGYVSMKKWLDALDFCRNYISHS